MEPAAPSDHARAAGRAVARVEFEQVIRRAAELSLSAGDSNDELTEDEVIRIAGELGLAPQHVRQAMFERPELTAPEHWLDRYFGPAIFSVSRLVPGQSAATMRRIENYLVTCEYLQVARRRSDSVAFIPAADTVSSVARALFRPSSRHLLARASRVVVGVHAMPEEHAHVRFDVDLADARRETIKAGITVGILGGVFTGSIAAGVVAGLLPASAIDPAPHILAFAGGMAGTIAAAGAAAASRFRNRIFSARFELAGLLDRVEQGEKLNPPPAPWRRKLFGDRADR